MLANYVVNIAVTIVALIIIRIWVSQNKDIKLYTVPIIVWLIHVLIFYLVLSLDTLTGLRNPATLYNYWSTYLRTHALITIILSFSYLIEWNKVLHK